MKTFVARFNRTVEELDFAMLLIALARDERDFTVRNEEDTGMVEIATAIVDIRLLPAGPWAWKSTEK